MNQELATEAHSSDLATTPVGPLMPADYDETTRAKLAALDAASDTEAKAQRPDNTTRSYASDWKTWLEFTGTLKVPATAATRGTLRLFVKWLWERQHRAATTIDRKLAGVTVTLRTDYGVVIAPEDTAAARELLKDYKKQAAATKAPPRGRGKAPAMQLDALRRIAAACPDTLTGKRDRAVVLLGFSIAARRAELAGLTLRDITPDPKGLLVHVRVSKVEPRVVAVPFGKNPETCPVLAWQAGQKAAELTGPDT
ncbi:MAG: integrase, partial [Streptosporangiaceae bacterium]|nr:integrase [Streptosporangiaceae bacterium]